MQFNVLRNFTLNMGNYMKIVYFQLKMAQLLLADVSYVLHSYLPYRNRT